VENNGTGSVGGGAIAGYARARGGLPSGLETILLVGLLGGFTTYSSFAFQSVEMLDAGRIMPAAAYVVGTTVAALLAAWAGLRLFSA
jgi:CrcB protein